jgi:hypothetical protein
VDKETVMYLIVERKTGPVLTRRLYPTQLFVRQVREYH